MTIHPVRVGDRYGLVRLSRHRRQAQPGSEGKRAPPRAGTTTPVPVVGVDPTGASEEEHDMTTPQEQFGELTRRTQENFKHLWDQWTQRSNELLKGVGSRSRAAGDAPGNPEQVLDAVFDFAENLIAQQRAFAKQMLHAASQGQQTLADVADSAAGRTGPTTVPSTPATSAPPATPGATPPEAPGS